MRLRWLGSVASLSLLLGCVSKGDTNITTTGPAGGSGAAAGAGGSAGNGGGSGLGGLGGTDGKAGQGGKAGQAGAGGPQAGNGGSSGASAGSSSGGAGGSGAAGGDAGAGGSSGQTGCSSDSDCADAYGCTTDQCVGGECKHDKTTASCAGLGVAKGVCLAGPKSGATGCCADDDGDGHPGLACGGDDCDDAKAAVFPGAAETCGGEDVNCIKGNAPAEGKSTQLTKDPNPKTNLRVATNPAGDRHLAVWNTNPEGGDVGFLLLDGSGAILKTGNLTGGDPSLLASDTVDVTYSPEHGTGAFAVSWMHGKQPPTVHLGWVDPEGTVDAKHVEVPYGSKGMCPIGVNSSLLMASHGGSYVFVTAYESTCTETAPGAPYPYGQPGYWSVSEVGGVPKELAFPSININYERVDRLLGLPDGFALFYAGATHLARFKASDTTPTVVPVSLEGSASRAQVTYDGEYFHVLAQHSAQTTHAIVTKQGAATKAKVGPSMRPLDLQYFENPADESGGVVAGLATDGTTVNFFVRHKDGSPSLPLGAIGGGNEIGQGRVLWTGSSYVALWTARPTDGVHQIYSSTIGCK